jgi:hypothetical protein
MCSRLSHSEAVSASTSFSGPIDHAFVAIDEFNDFDLSDEALNAVRSQVEERSFSRSTWVVNGTPALPSEPITIESMRTSLATFDALFRSQSNLVKMAVDHNGRYSFATHSETDPLQDLKYDPHLKSWLSPIQRLHLRLNTDRFERVRQLCQRYPSLMSAVGGSAHSIFFGFSLHMPFIIELLVTIPKLHIALITEIPDNRPQHISGWSTRAQRQVLVRELQKTGDLLRFQSAYSFETMNRSTVSLFYQPDHRGHSFDLVFVVGDEIEERYGSLVHA